MVRASDTDNFSYNRPKLQNSVNSVNVKIIAAFALMTIERKSFFILLTIVDDSKLRQRRFVWYLERLSMKSLTKYCLHVIDVQCPTYPNIHRFSYHFAEPELQVLSLLCPVTELKGITPKRKHSCGFFSSQISIILFYRFSVCPITISFIRLDSSFVFLNLYHQWDYSLFISAIGK